MEETGAIQTDAFDPGFALVRSRRPCPAGGRPRVAHLRRRPREHPLLARRPDRRRQLQRPRARLDAEHRQLRGRARVQPAVDAPHGRRRGVRDGGVPAGGHRGRCRDRPSCCGCTVSTRANGARRRRGGCPGAAWPGATTAARARSSTSRRAISSSASMPRPAGGCRDFGVDGIVDLKQNMDQDIDLVNGEVGFACRPRRRRGHEFSSGPRICRAAGRARCATSRATSGGSTPAPETGSGSSTPCPAPTSSATTPGSTTRGATRATPGSGGR